MKILFVCHKDPYGKEPRGAEKSVRAIIEYLAASSHAVFRCNTINSANKSIEKGLTPDIIISWGRPALSASQLANKYNIPFVLMVRFWRNIAPLPAGHLLDRPMEYQDTIFRERYKPMFRNAAAIITNTDFSRKVIERWQPVSTGKVYVSYVPVMGSFKQSGHDEGYLTIVTPEIYGEVGLVKYIRSNFKYVDARQRFMVVNCPTQHLSSFRFMVSELRGYTDMEYVWANTKILLVPVYYNDICGTRRVTVEALRRGIPVLALNRSGMDEIVDEHFLVNLDKEWVTKLNMIDGDYDKYKELAKVNWEKYNTAKQLKEFENVIKLSIKIKAT